MARPDEELRAAQRRAEGLKATLEDIDDTLESLGNKIYRSTTIDPDKSVESFKKSLQSIDNIASQLAQHQEQISIYGKRSKGLSSDQLKDLSSQLKYQQQKLLQEKASIKANADILRLKIAQARASGNEALAAGLEEELGAVLEAQERVTNAIDNSTDAQKRLNKEAGKAKLSEIGTKTKEAFESGMGPLTGMFNIFGLISKAVGGLINAVIEYDKRLGDTATSMSITYDEADKSNKAMAAFAQSSKSAYDTSEDLNKTVVDLNKNLGTTIKFEQLTGALKEDVALMSQLENIAGLTAEESQGILKYTLATGQSATQATKDLMANYKVAGLKRGVVLNEKDALKEISKLSNLIKLSTAGGAAGLAKAVASAKALGTDLNKVNDIAGSILNFEESIEAELSAELLTGKDLSLEKARQAALNNDLATVSDEIAKNVGSAADFGKMNRIQQEAIAKAVGMTASELADTLTNQEALKSMGAATVEEAQKKFDLLVKEKSLAEAMEIMGENALTRQFQATNMQKEAEIAQKRANDGIILAIDEMSKYKDQFKKILDFVLSIISNAGILKAVLVGIGAVIALQLVKGIASFISGIGTGIKLLREMKVLEKVNAGIAIVKGAWQSVGGTPIVGPLLAGAAIGAGLTALAAAAMDDGIISPSTGGGGYGDRVLFGPEGAISFNNKDTIVAGTNLFKANDMVSSPGGSVQINQAPDNSKDIAELKGAIVALASRPVDVAIDGKKVIEATTGAQPNTAGVESAKNSYRIQ